jgi:2-polyprenyl-3-methyl-5-hydroxy-6-metoxy-1,4-benzoquinol methylase
MKNISENQIRPAHLMNEQKSRVLTDLGRVLSRHDEFVSVTCPACGEIKSTDKYEHNGLRYVECINCETFYINPRPSPAVLDWFYKDSVNYEYWNDVIFPASEESRRENIFVPRVDRLLAYCNKYDVDKSSLLEVGAGFGTFCHELQARNEFNRVVAVEPNRSLAKTCREKGIEVIEKPIEKINLSNDDLFDVIVNFEVIEHLFDPASFVKSCADLLRVGGLFMLTCPNGKGFDIETMGPISDTVDNEHLNYFNKKSLGILFQNAGFEVQESSTPGVLDADLVRNKILSGDFDISAQPFLKKILIDEWEELGGAFQKFLVEHELSSNIWIIGKKL